jgi:selenocysteine lyase/cysteine desulfurase
LRDFDYVKDVVEVIWFLYSKRPKSLGYAAVFEGLNFIEQVGGPAAIQRHSTRLVARLLRQIDTDAYRVLTPNPDRSPILALRVRNLDGLGRRLAAAGTVISVGGDMSDLMRISPAIYNNDADIDRLAGVLRG